MAVKNKDGTISTSVVFSGAKLENVNLQNSVSIPNNGKVFEVDSAATLTVEIFGTSTSRTIKFEMQGVGGKWYPAKGVRISDQTYATATETSGTDEMWQFDLIGMKNFRARVHAISGGNISIKGESSAAKANLSPISNQNLNMNITGQAKELDVKLSGSSLDLRGLAANKPAANAVQIGTTYWSVDTDPLAMKAEVSDGTKWTVMG